MDQEHESELRISREAETLSGAREAVNVYEDNMSTAHFGVGTSCGNVGPRGRGEWTDEEFCTVTKGPDLVATAAAVENQRDLRG